MSKLREINEQFSHLSNLLDNLEVWEGPTKEQEATTRKSIETIVVDYVFGDDCEVRYGRKVSENDLNPKLFQSTDKVEIERREDKDLGSVYDIKAKISTLGADQNMSIYFEGHISESEGLSESKPVLIRR